MVVIVDYGMGNLVSVLKALKRLNTDVIISSKHDDIKMANKLILPGVGHFRNGITRLTDLGLIDLLNKRVLHEKIPILGICLGMQLFTEYSEEGDSYGLGWFNAQTVKFSFNHNQKQYRIPHMGWNSLKVQDGDGILKGVGDENFFYFVHSYYVKCRNRDEVLSMTNYGVEFDSTIQRDNIVGMQFHPEKSHSCGLKLLRNFVEEI